MTQKALKARYPYMFEGPNLGIAISRGWFPMVEKLCADIDQLLGDDKHGFNWAQIKQKYGSIRLYWEFDPRGKAAKGGEPLLSRPKTPNRLRPLQEAIDKLVQEVETLTETCCMVCGSPGREHSSGGYILVLCPKHAAERESGTMESPWFPPDES
jgi:hypothetical protein